MRKKKALDQLEKELKNRQEMIRRGEDKAHNLRVVEMIEKKIAAIKSF